MPCGYTLVFHMLRGACGDGCSRYLSIIISSVEALRSGASACRTGCCKTQATLRSTSWLLNHTTSLAEVYQHWQLQQGSFNKQVQGQQPNSSVRELDAGCQLTLAALRLL